MTKIKQKQNIVVFCLLVYIYIKTHGQMVVMKINIMGIKMNRCMLEKSRLLFVL